MTAPTDGYFVYESWSPINGQTISSNRLNQIAAGGFALVLNYAILHAHIGPGNNTVLGYLNAAQSAGLKVLFALNDPAIWYNNTISTSYPELYADSGNLGTDATFTPWLVNQVKSHPALWGYYIGDELQQYSNSHTAMLAHYGYVTGADNTHPVLIIQGSPNVANGTDTFFDCCTVEGDDFYPYGDENAQLWLSTATEASGIQTFCTSKSLNSAIVMQAFSWTQYYPPTHGMNWPARSGWPGATLMRSNRDAAIAHMTSRVIGWYTYYNLLTADIPSFRWSELAWASNNTGTQPVTPTIANQTLFYAYTDQSGWPNSWAHPVGALTAAVASLKGTLTGETAVNILLANTGITIQPGGDYLYCARGILSSSAGSAAWGIVFDYVDSNNYKRCQVTASGISLIQVTAGTPTTLGSNATNLSGSRCVLTVEDTGTSYTVKAGSDQDAIATTNLFTVSHSTITRALVYQGVYCRLNSTGDTFSLYNHTSMILNNGTSPSVLVI